MSSVTVESRSGFYRRQPGVQLKSSGHFSTSEATSCAYIAHVLVFAVIFLVALECARNDSVQVFEIQLANPPGSGPTIVAATASHASDHETQLLPSHEPERHIFVKPLHFNGVKNYEPTSAQIVAENGTAKIFIYWDTYMEDLRTRIKQEWIPVGIKKTNNIVVQFKVHTDGTLSDLHLLRSADSQQIADAVLEAVKRAAPFRAFPLGLVELSMWK